MRVIYLLGVGDAGVSADEFIEFLDGLESRSEWLRTKMKTPDRLAAG